MNNISSLKNIKTPEDIKSFKIVDIFEDDHQQCAECVINGVPIEFLWYDSIGFVEYWNESKKAFKQLKDAIKYSIQMAEEEQD